METDNRAQDREAEFWDKVAAKTVVDEARLRVAPDHGHDHLMPWLEDLGMGEFTSALRDHLRITPGLKVLDMGCGQGFLSVRLALAGATVHGIDISPVSIQRCHLRAQISGCSDRCKFSVMDCESLDLEDASVDAVTGCFVLHHLDLAKAASEVARVLKPGARAAFIETMGLNPALMTVRRLLPGRFGIEKASSDDEYPLTASRMNVLRRNFKGKVSVQFPQVVCMRMGVYLPFLRGHLAKRALYHADAALGKIPGGGRLGYYGLVTMDRVGGGP